MTTDPMSLQEHRMSRSSTSPETLSIRRQLRAAVDGRVVTADDGDYDQARELFYGGFDRRPQAIVWPTDTTEVAEVVSLAAERGLELAVRGGGHSTAGHSVSDGGIVLDTSALKSLEIDTARRTAWAQTGLTAGELTGEAARHGLAIGFGDTASVGIGGITLGGGIGYLSRKHGLTIDSLLAAELVTADGQTVRTDAGTHPELFWAIRGGGGNFGVATRLQYQLHELDGVVGGMLLLPATVETIAGFVAAAEAAPEELSAIGNILPAPPMPFIPEQAHGQLVMMAMICFAGDPEAGQDALAPFRALATPLADMVRPIGYPEMYPPEEPGFHPTAVSHTMFLDRVDTQAAATILEHLQASDAVMRATQLRVLGGAIARVPDDATAYAHRQRAIMVNLAAFYQGPDDRPGRQQWVERFAAALSPVDDGAYVNFLGEDGPARIHQAYPGPTWDRLVEVKRRWDPTNLFRHNHNIPPGG
jgi:FAD/FMN-containing dehydrogenase